MNVVKGRSFNPMIRLITCDLDGTLLPHGQWAPSEECFSIIRRLREHGIAFAAASGRQYHSLRTLFAPVADEILYIAENGSVVFDGNTLLSQTVLDPDKARILTEQIVSLPETEVMISGAKHCYLMPKSDVYVHHIRDVLRFSARIVSSYDEIDEPVIKVSACRLEHSQWLYEQLGAAWEADFQVAVAGREWLDFTLADKGTGLDALCRHLGIHHDDVMSFGDNYNDLPLLLKAGHPFIMENACDELKTQFPVHCVRVETTLQNFLAQIG